MISFNEYADNIMKLRYSHTSHSGHVESWHDIAYRVVNNIVLPQPKIPAHLRSAIYQAIVQRKLVPGGRILSQAGREYHQTDNCFCVRAVDTREGWADLLHKCTLMFMSGGGVGIEYSDVRPYGTPLARSGGIASGPVSLIQAVNAIGAAARQGGERRGAIYASLLWNHPDIQQFIHMKDMGGLDHTNISVRFDKHFFDDSDNAIQHYNFILSVLKNALQTGDPGFQYDCDTQILRNACTEIISADDCDSCCLASVNIAAIQSPQEMSYITSLGILLLLCNTLYTHTPHEKVAQVKEQNRRLGLGLMGIGEWFITNKLPYGDTSLEPYLNSYAESAYCAGKKYADMLGISRPVATRAVAPTGTISIVGGRTTSGIEPLFAGAYLRTYNTLATQEYKQGYRQEVIIEPLLEKLFHQGYDLSHIDTAWSLSQDIEGIKRRIQFQAFVQQYVDNAISSTVNMPMYSEGDEVKIAPLLIRHLPQMRGITFYPDGAKEHQPIIPLDVKQALQMKNTQMQESESCKGGVCGL